MLMVNAGVGCRVYRILPSLTAPVPRVCIDGAVDKLIHYTNLDGRVNAFYSSPTIFTNALNAANVTWSVKVRLTYGRQAPSRECC